MISGETIAAMTSGRAASDDGLHLLSMDLHKGVNRLQSEISTEEVDGTKAYGINQTDRSLLAAFMRGDGVDASPTALMCQSGGAGHH